LGHLAGSDSKATMPISRLTLTPVLSVDRSLGAAASKVVKNSAGRVFSLHCVNLNAAIRYFQLFDSATAPSGGATPLEAWPVALSGGLLTLDVTALGSLGVGFATGITWGFSTTALTYTAGSATDAIVTVRYV
jgi:hypothetical protein